MLTAKQQIGLASQAYASAASYFDAKRMGPARNAAVTAYALAQFVARELAERDKQDLLQVAALAYAAQRDSDAGLLTRMHDEIADFLLKRA